jgi:hypothetical protein
MMEIIIFVSTDRIKFIGSKLLQARNYGYGINRVRIPEDP